MLHVPCGAVRASAPHSHLGIQAAGSASTLQRHHLHIFTLSMSGKGETAELCPSFSLPPQEVTDIPPLTFHRLELIPASQEEGGK